MALGTLVHFGFDQSFRQRVLESAGFSVADCDSLEELSTELLQEPDALVLEEEPTGEIDKAISLSRTFPSVALILFRPMVETAPRSADLTIRSFTPPELWLREIEDLLEHTRVLLVRSRRIQAESSTLVEDLTALRKTAQQNRVISRRQRRSLFEK